MRSIPPEKIQPPATKRGLPPYRWSMRVVGFVLAVSAALFLGNDYVAGGRGAWLMAFCVGVGVITFCASWMPRPSRALLRSFRPQSTLEKHRRASGSNVDA